MFLIVKLYELQNHKKRLFGEMIFDNPICCNDHLGFRITHPELYEWHTEDIVRVKFLPKTEWETDARLPFPTVHLILKPAVCQPNRRTEARPVEITETSNGFRSLQFPLSLRRDSQ